MDHSQIRRLEREFRHHGLISLSKDEAHMLSVVLEHKLKRPNGPQRAAKLAHAVFERTGQNNPDRTHIACRSGCAHCCQIMAACSAPEVFRIVEFLKSKGIHRHSKRWRQLREDSERLRGVGVNERCLENIMCSFLSQAKCTIYDVRPLTCRGFTSFSLQACLAAVGRINVKIPESRGFHEARVSVTAAMFLASYRATLDWRLYEVSEAVVRAMETDEAVDRWLKNEDIFAGVQLDAGTADVDVDATFQAFMDSIDTERAAL